MARSGPPPAVTLAKLFGILLVVSLLFAALLLPYVGGMGLVGKHYSAKFLDQPCNLTETAPPLKTTMYARDGKTVIATIFQQNRQPVPLAQMPMILQQALISTEDRRFYEHQGVDMRGLLRSALQTSSGDTQGGSTLTMQYVKQERYYQALNNPTAQAAAVEQTINRKIEDAQCAIAIEKREPKKQILENYLNIAFFGENAYGIQTAAQTYFGKPAKDLTLAESATLVGLLRAPSEYDPFTNRKESQARRNLVIDNLVDQNYITPAQGQAAKAQPIRLATTKVQLQNSGCPNSNPDLHNVAFFCDYVSTWLTDTVKAISDSQLSNGGLSIVTTLDPKLQNATQDGLAHQMPANSSTTAIMPQVDPTTGDVLAFATSKQYGNPLSASDTTHTVLPVFTAPTTGSASTYKLFTMLAALNAGAPSTLTLANNDAASRFEKYKTRYCSGASYLAQNSEGQSYGRNETLASAIAKSSNTYFVALEDEFFNNCDLTAPVQTALDLGMNSLNDVVSGTQTKAQIIEAQRQATFTLGQTETSPLELTGAYAAVANDGVFCPPAPVRSITDASGQQIDPKRAACSRKLSTYVAREARTLLTPDTTGAQFGGTATAAFSSYYAQGGSEIAGKTGTNNGVVNNKEVGASSLWFVGLTPRLTATTALVNLNSSSKPLTDLPDTTPGQTVFGVYAANIWAKVLTPNLPVPHWSWPDVSDVPGGQQVPNVVGKDVAEATATLTAQGYKVNLYANKPYCGSSGNIPAFAVGYQQPPVAAPGDTVTICQTNTTSVLIYQPPPPPAAKPSPNPASPSAAPGNPAPAPAPASPTPSRRRRPIR